MHRRTRPGAFTVLLLLFAHAAPAGSAGFTAMQGEGSAPPDTSGAALPTPPGPAERTPGPVYDLDRIAAIVNDSVILQSEVEEQTFFYIRQQGISPSDSAAVNRAMKEVLDRLIEEKVIVDEARKRGMTVSPDEIDNALEGMLQDMIRGAGSEEAFRAELEREGLTEQELRDLYKPRIEAQILASRLVRREVGSQADVTEAEIEQYYKENEETFPERPETVRLSHIYVAVRADSAAYARARGVAEEIRLRALAGEDFGELARQYSADPSAKKGGDLGTFSKGQLDPEFERAVFSLEPGQVGPVVQTRLGFHVIKLTEKGGDTARASHILIPVAPTEEAASRAREKAYRIKAELDAGGNFAELAQAESEDEETKEIGGDLGYFALDDLMPEVKEAIAKLSPGEISEVVEIQDGYHIFLLAEHKPRGRYTLDEAREKIRELLRRQKFEQNYQKWVEDLKKDAYIDIKGN